MRRALRRLLRLLAGASYRLSRLTSYAAAGTLKRAELGAAIAGEWDRWSSSAPATPADLHPWERRLYAEHLHDGERVLIVGVGTGREVAPLLARGCRVEGVDASARGIEIGRASLAARGLEVPLHASRIEAFEPAGGFDAIVFSWFCYAYIPGSSTRVATLARLRPALAAGGRIVIWYLQRDARESAWPVRAAWLFSWLARSDWRPEPGDVIEGGGEAGISHFEHRATAEEMEAELGSAGYRVMAHGTGPEAWVVATATGP